MNRKLVEQAAALLEDGDVAGARAILRQALRRGRGDKWPWADMEEWETFVMVGVSLASARIMARRAAVKYGRRFDVTLTRDGPEVVRLA